MILEAYRQLLKLPRFKGRDRFISFCREKWFQKPTASLVHNIQFEPDAFEWAQSDLLRDGCLEPLTTSLYAKLLRPGDTYIDVGAHVGFHTLLARHLIGEQGRVIAVEPQPYNCSKILDNWRANDFANLFLYVAACGDEEERVTLQPPSRSDTSRLSLVGPSANDGAQKFEVPLRRLDNILRERGVKRVPLLKIDVEGFELKVINGISDRLPDVDHLIIELLDAGPNPSDNTITVIGNLRGAGFQLSTVTGQEWDGESRLPENNLLATHHTVAASR
jgi:FkbM family methyltransferase